MKQGRFAWIVPALYILFLMTPIYWLVAMSFKTNLEITTRFTLLPETFNLDNYVKVFTDERWRAEIDTPALAALRPLLRDTALAGRLAARFEAQGRWPALQTLIPPGLAPQVAQWDPVALGYEPSGQRCPRFRHVGLVLPGTEVDLADTAWQVHAAPGHDPDSVILFEPGSRTLISADALWENGFGVVFPELDERDAFDEVGATFDLIERLGPRWVIPGHGPVFRYGAEVLVRARERLRAFVQRPDRHAHHAAKVLLKFKLLECRQMLFVDYVQWAAGTPHFQGIHRRFAPAVGIGDWIDQLTQELVHSQVVRRVGESVHDA